MRIMRRETASRWLAFIAVSVLVAGTAIGAEPGNKARGRLGLLRRALASLDLTDAQKTDIRGVFEKGKPSLQDLTARVKSDRETLRAAAGAAAPDAAAVGKAFLKLRSDGKDLRGALQKLGSDVRSFLTPEQQARLDGYIAASKHRRNG
jgi:Spy/CpxP family protein refolding chaperone